MVRGEAGDVRAGKWAAVEKWGVERRPSYMHGRGGGCRLGNWGSASHQADQRGEGVGTRRAKDRACHTLLLSGGRGGTAATRLRWRRKTSYGPPTASKEGQKVCAHSDSHTKHCVFCEPQATDTWLQDVWPGSGLGERPACNSAHTETQAHTRAASAGQTVSVPKQPAKSVQCEVKERVRGRLPRAITSPQTNVICWPTHQTILNSPPRPPQHRQRPTPQGGGHAVRRSHILCTA